MNIGDRVLIYGAEGDGVPDGSAGRVVDIRLRDDDLAVIAPELAPHVHLLYAAPEWHYLRRLE